jgi:hypothetical protein
VATLEGDILKLQVEFGAEDQPDMDFDPVPITIIFNITRAADPPAVIKQLKIELDPFTMQFPGLDTFTTQNTFAPGMHFLKLSEVMIPHDVILMGAMVSPTRTSVQPSEALVQDKGMLRVAVRSLSLEATADNSSPFQLQKLIDCLYRDNFFLGECLQLALEGTLDELQSFLQGQGFHITPESLKKLAAWTSPGPEFDIRFAGGAYRIRSDGPRQFLELFVDPVNRTLFGKSDEKTDAAGPDG